MDILVQAATPALMLEAERLAASLGLGATLAQPAEAWRLLVTAERLELHPPPSLREAPLWVELVGGAMGLRLAQGARGWGPLAKAVGLKGDYQPRVVDATAGWGRDGCLLAAMGCQVTLVERAPVMALLLEDGVRRARRDPQLAPILAHLTGPLLGEARQVLAALDPPPQVVYLDPMYPTRHKAALVKKAMRHLRALVGEDDDAPALLQTALHHASRRVVVKRPAQAPPLPGPSPHHAIHTPGTRYDVYPCA